MAFTLGKAIVLPLKSELELSLPKQMSPYIPQRTNYTLKSELP